MPRTQLTEAQYHLVAAVAEREGWADLSDPPLTGGPRSLDEQDAVMRFVGALPSAPAPTPRGWNERHARILMCAVGAVGLVVCWIVSPERTAAALLMVGVFCLFAVRRRGRRSSAARVPARRGLGW